MENRVTGEVSPHRYVDIGLLGRINPTESFGHDERLLESSSNVLHFEWNRRDQGEKCCSLAAMLPGNDDDKTRSLAKEGNNIACIKLRPL